MKKSEFIEKLKETLEIEGGEFSEDTNLRELKEYDSLSLLAIVALVDEYFGKKLTAADLYKNITTVKSLINIIGEDNFK